MGCVAKGVAFLAVCVPALCAPALCGPGVATADNVNVASVESWPDASCVGGYSWHVINGLKDSSVRATVIVQRDTGTEDDSTTQYVYDLKRAEQDFVSCGKIQAKEGLYNVSVRLVSAEKV